MKKVEVLDLVNSSASSIFSKEDVINLIKGIDEVKGITKDQIEKIIDDVIDNLERNIEDVIDYTSAEFNIGYDNKIKVESIELHFDYIREALDYNLCNFAQDEEDDFIRITDVEREEPAGAVSI